MCFSVFTVASLECQKYYFILGCYCYTHCLIEQFCSIECYFWVKSSFLILSDYPCSEIAVAPRKKRAQTLHVASDRTACSG